MRLISQKEQSAVLKRLAHVGALATSAESCFIFLLASFPEVEHVVDLELVAFHSSYSVNDQAFIEKHDQSPIGWIALHAMPLHIPSVEDPHEFTEVYTETVEVRSFFGAPLIPPGESTALGVIACDSSTERAFSRIHTGLIEHLAAHIADLLLKQRLDASRTQVSQNSWDEFKVKLAKLVEALGKDGVEIMRLASLNFAEIERIHGLQGAMDIVEQCEALIQQSIPPQFPLFRLPNGDILIGLDKMMVTFVESKIAELLKTFHTQGKRLDFNSIVTTQGDTTTDAHLKSVREFLTDVPKVLPYQSA